MTTTYLGIAEANAWLQEKYTNRTLWLALHIAEPTRLADPATEVLGGGYERQLIIFGAPSSGNVANTNGLIFAGMPGCIVTWVSVWTGQFGGQMVHASEQTSPQTVAAGSQYLAAPNDVAFGA